MDQKLVYAKTSIGEEAVRQSSRVVQRNLRVVLVQVDGKLSVGELAAKIGNVRLVEAALKELEEGGYIFPGHESPSAPTENKRPVRRTDGVSALSQMSMFGPRSILPGESTNGARSQSSAFSTFGKPILSVPRHEGNERDESEWGAESQPEPEPLSSRSLVRIATWAGSALVVLAILVLALFPYDRFRPELAASLEKALHAPVTVGAVRVEFLPVPQVIASDVRVGNGAELIVEKMVLPAPFSLYMSGASALTSMRLSGVSVVSARLLSLAGSVNPGNLQKVSIERMAITASPMAINELSGEIVFTSAGMESLSLQTADRTLRMQAKSAAGGLSIDMEAYGWRPVSDQPVAFDVMRGKAFLKPGRLLVEDIDSTFLGGVLKGSAVLDWNGGVSLATDLKVARLDMKRITGLLLPKLEMEGELSGPLHLRCAGKDAGSFWNACDLSMNAEVSRGVLHGLDLGETARRGRGYAIRSGNTKFDFLRGDITFDSKGFQGKNMLLESGMLSASGQLMASRDLELDGKLSVLIRGASTGLRMPVSIGGRLPALIATVDK